ncbi:mercuric reductase [Amniculicola lignicola CBS 123094]|uniref:Mercuric reductase n=1 Tax=Amniculicola lignicola CBS 123094 TaxID=1392246 RepID=A0A6A5WK70_9PLEO|nr:mercuric reductase [Amniculicola lignicola CBS 123094]
MSSPTPKHYNALILGSGQSGTPLATHLSSLSLSVCLIERSHIAGCCVNEGCTPTKTMVASGRVAYFVGRAGEYGDGDSGNSGVRIDMKKIRQRKRDIVESFRGGSERRLEGKGVDVLMGEARFEGEKEVRVSVAANAETGGLAEERRFTADTIYINVGCRPSRADIPGLEEVQKERVLDSTSIQELDEVPRHLVVVGGGVVGLEFGQLVRRLGGRVSIVHRGERLLSRGDDAEMVECMQDILKEDGVELYLNASGTTVSKSSDPELPISVSTTPGTKPSVEIHASHILLATGRIPNTDSLKLSTAGIQTTPSGHIIVSPTLETNIPGIYALGDVKGGPAFTHISYDDFRIIRDNLSLPPSAPKDAFRTTHSRTPYIPSVIYTDPQYAHIGPRLSLLPSNRTYISYSMPCSWIARGLETDETRGMWKIVVDKETEEIVSFSAISTEAGEVMSVVQMAMLGGVKGSVLREAIWAHPSWAEGLNNIWGGEKREFGR